LHNIELGGDFKFEGTVKINISIEKPTRSIVLNAIQLELKQAKVSGLSTSNFSYDKDAQRVTLSFDEEVQASSDAVLEVEYSGIVNNDMCGFYRSRYKPTETPVESVPKVGEYHYMFSTQFESSDCRRALPCFDEPSLKATFDVEIEIPKDQLALSNMPEKGTRDGSNGRKIVSFQRTPKMSTYV
jgi:aminopeptidase N